MLLPASMRNGQVFVPGKKQNNKEVDRQIFYSKQSAKNVSRYVLWEIHG